MDDPPKLPSNISSHVVSFDQEVDSPTRPNLTTQPQSDKVKYIFSFLGSPLKMGLFLIYYLLAHLCVYSAMFLVICVCFVLLVIAITLGYCCILIIALATLPLLVISLLITRIFQFIKYGYDYKRLTNFKHLIRGWLYIDVAMVLVALWIFFPIAKYVPSIKQVTFLNLPFTRWVVIISIICGFYLISYVVYMLTHRITRILNVRSLNVAQAFSEIIDGLIFWWAEHEVMKRVPTFKNHEILGLPTRKWLRVSILVLIGYNLITLFTHIAVMSLRRICQQHPRVTHKSFWQNVLGRHLHKKFIVYFANGMKLSISFIMSSLLLLLTWVLYFGTRLDMKIGKTKSIWEYGLWTLVTLLICAFFWLIKTFVLLAWEVHTVYSRLEHSIISISEQLYFLGILDCDKHDIFKLRNDIVEDDNEQEASTVETSQRGGDNSLTNCFGQIVTSLFDLIPKGAKKKLNFEKRERIKNELLLHKDPTMDDLQRASHFFIVAKGKLLKETYICDILETFDATSDNREKLKQIIDHHEKNDGQGKILNQRQRGSGEEGVDKEHEQEGAKQSSSTNCAKQINDWDQFVIKLRKQLENSSVISYADIQTWVERAHHQCMYLANTLSSAEEVAGCLNKIISWLLIAATFIMWLLLTGLATTQVLVLIASPLLAATFIFGNTCKTLFEGILFVYVVHPLDVGDLCVIDDKMMEVTAIGIWTTTFTKVDKLGTQEVVIYPNLELANRVIINHKTKFDWSDCVEFNLGYVNLTNINNQEEIIEFFKGHFKKANFEFLSSNSIVSVMGDSIKLVFRLRYKADNTKGWTYSECLRRKNKLQADFCLLMQDVISKFKSEQKGKGAS